MAAVGVEDGRAAAPRTKEVSVPPSALIVVLDTHPPHWQSVSGVVER